LLSTLIDFIQNYKKIATQKICLDNTISGLEDDLFTGASERGTWVRLFQPLVEGKVIRGFEGLDVGNRVRVQLIGTDVERGFIDFARAG
jgi:hypothetical protein